MTDNTVLATTTNVVKGTIGRVMDRPGPRSISVPLADAGDSADATHGFAAALYAAVGLPGVNAAPVPTLCEVSLDGGTTVDARFIIEHVAPDLHTGTLLATADGQDTGVLYNSLGPDRFPATNLALADVLGGATGAIVPKSAGNYGISVGGAIPNLRGLLVPKPGSEPGATAGSPMWLSAASARVTMMGVVSNALSSALAFVGVTIQSWEDTTGRIITSLVKQLGGVIFAADTYDQGSRGHAVWCDSDVNISGDIQGVVCDGTASISNPSGSYGYSNATSGTNATATSAITAGAVSSVTVTAGGTGYTSAPTVSFSGGAGTGAAATAAITGGAVSSVTVTAGGTGYTSAPAVAFSGGGGRGGAGVPRALVIGNVGGNPAGVAFTFDGTSSAGLTPAQEPSTARLLADETTLTPDLSTLYGEVQL
ncbi:MAG: hypothetical protein LC769_07305, partial [Chloroflexi bacterium]|nr:hypothetical protein [Chloroflexota bacterium]